MYYIEVEVELLLETKIYEQLSQGEGCVLKSQVNFTFKEIPEDVWYVVIMKSTA